MSSAQWEDIFQYGQGFSPETIRRLNQFVAGLVNSIASGDPGSITVGGSSTNPILTLANQRSVTADGAVGDGVADDTVAIQATITTIGLAGGGTVFFPKGTYKVTAQLTGIKPFTRLLFASGAVVDGSGLGAGLQLFSTSPTSTNDANQVSLTADCAAGATTLTIAAGAESAFTVGGYVKIGSHKQWSADTALADSTMDGWRGEIGIVSAIASGLLTVQWATFDAYATADSAFVAPITMTEGIVVEGPGKIIGPQAGGCRGFKFDRCLHLRVRDITMVGWDDAAFQCRDPYDAVFDGISVIGGTSTQTSFYGITWQYAAQFCTVVNSVFKDVRHAATTDQVNTVRAGISRFISYVNCKAFRTKAASFDCHAYGEHITIQGCHSYYSTDHGISVRCPSAVIKDNVIVAPATHGIYLRNQTLQPSRYTVEGNHVVGAGSNGINWRTPSETALAGTHAGDTIDGVIISGNIIKGSGAEGIICQSASGFNNLSHGTVHGNIIKFSSATQTGISLIRCTDIVVRGNTCTTAATGISLDDNCDHCLLIGNNVRGSTTPLSLGAGVGHVVETTVGSNQGTAPPLTVARTSDSAAKTNNTLADDDTLQFGVSGNSTDIWLIEIYLFFNAANITMDAQVSLSAPSGCTGRWGFEPEISNLGGFGAVSTGTTPVALNTSFSGSTVVTFGTPSGLTGVKLVCQLRVGNTAGTFKVRWAQNTTDAGNLILEKGSFLRATKLA